MLKMLKKVQAVIALCCMVSYAAAGTRSIGTVSAHGDMRVDGYSVNGNATLFDGSVVETGFASATLRLGTGVEITMASDSEGTLYSERMVLQHGASELTASDPFELQARGFCITPTAPNSRGMVSLRAGNSVEVFALSGAFKVTNRHGALLASVRPGLALTFAALDSEGSAAQEAGSTSFSDVGTLSYAEGHYYLSDDSGSTFELIGKDLHAFVGDQVIISGTVANNTQSGGVSRVVSVNKIELNRQKGHKGRATGMSTPTKIILGTAIVAGVNGAVIGILDANQAAVPASR
jgi:Protein of unknown function (DUF5818)